MYGLRYVELDERSLFPHSLETLCTGSFSCSLLSSHDIDQLVDFIFLKLRTLFTLKIGYSFRLAPVVTGCDHSP